MTIHVTGAGNWGTTLAKLFADTNEVRLCTHSAEHSKEINELHENIRYLAGVSLPKLLTAVPLADALFAPEDVVVIAVPSRALPELAKDLRPRLAGTPLVCATKGFQHATFKTMGQLVRKPFLNLR